MSKTRRFTVRERDGAVWESCSDMACFASPPRVSTVTATAYIGFSPIDLDTLFRSLPLCDDIPGIAYVQYGQSKDPTFTRRGVHPRPRKPRPSNRVTARKFDNQVTVVLCVSEAVHVNVKVFANGNVQTTGAKSTEVGRWTVDWIATQVSSIFGPEQGGSTGPFGDRNYRIRLINTDFRVGMEIRRDELYRMMVSEAFENVRITYEPCIYPAVKIECYHRAGPKDDVPCICKAGAAVPSRKCTACRKVTFAVFRSGCILHTGNDAEHMARTREFVVNYLSQHQDRLRQTKAVAPSLA